MQKPEPENDVEDDAAVQPARLTTHNSEPENDVADDAALELARPTSENESHEGDVAVDLVRPSCDHGGHIRNEAIRLASIACGRALRRTIVLHPAVIAGFVDDAIAAAGNPPQACIRVNPDAIAAIANSPHERVADPNLGRGDIVVELDATSIETNVDTFAAILVRAAAEAL
jgi:hypothetical protein